MKKSVRYQNGILVAMKRSLAIFCSAAAVLTGLDALPASAAPIGLSSLQLNGNGPAGDQYPRLIDGGNTLRLLPNYDVNDPAHPTDGLASAGLAPAASAWYPNPLPVAGGFTTTFEFRMSDQTGGWDWLGGYGPPNPPDGADGIAFVIQTQGLGAGGVGAGGVGYAWMTHGVALEFDTWKNAPWDGDPDDNHISLKSSKSVDDDILVPHHICMNASCIADPTIITGHRCTAGGSDGILTSTQCTTDYPYFPGDLVTDFWKTDTLPYRCNANPEVASVGSLTIDLNDGAWHTVKVEYVPGTMKVYLDDLVGQPALTASVDLGQLLDLPCDGTAYVGFTSGERGGYQNHDIRLWDYEGNAVGSLVADFSYSPDSVYAGDTIQFSGTASGGVPPYSYSWDFGDGGTSTDANPSHSYTDAGTYTVKLTVTPSRCAPVTVEKTITVTVTDECTARLNINKFYDANSNGINDDGQFITGWPVQIEGTTYHTPASEEVGAGTYTVSESLSGTWESTTLTSVDTTLACGQTQTVEFGNLCLGGGGGLTPGFWSNKNGAKLVGSDDLALLAALNLMNVEGTDFDPTSHSQLKTWLNNAGATNMASMLSAHLAAMELNVFNGKVSGGALIYAPDTETANSLGYAAVNAVMAEANTEIGLHPKTPAGDPNRAYQEALKNVLDKANNNSIFVQPVPCPF